MGDLRWFVLVYIISNYLIIFHHIVTTEKYKISCKWLLQWAQSEASLASFKFEVTARLLTVRNSKTRSHKSNCRFPSSVTKRTRGLQRICLLQNPSLDFSLSVRLRLHKQTENIEREQPEKSWSSPGLLKEHELQILENIFFLNFI